MVTILKGNSRGSRLGQTFADAMNAGAQQGMDYAQQLGMQKAKSKLEMEELSGLHKQIQEQNRKKKGMGPQDDSSMGDRLSSGDPNAVQKQAMEEEDDETPSLLDMLISKKNPALANQRTRKEIQGRKEKFSRESGAEKELNEMEDKLESLEQSGMRFDRLNELFGPELESKFPSALLTAAFTKNGELNPIAAANLSPEAQEATKLVTDEIKGAKDTFGARVTNFDAATYLKTLPTQLNTAEGRRRVLRDLRIMNQLNRMRNEGVLDIMDRYPPGDISLSRAQRIFRKENKTKIDELRQEFINPEKAEFSDLPEASRYKGRTITDDETGQVFISNGKEWLPQ